MSSPIKMHKTTEVKLSDIQYSPYNPRRITAHEIEKLKKSIQTFGLVDPLIVNKRNNQVVGGNQRLKCLKELGVEKVNVIYVDLDDKKEKALNVALNKISGEFDFDKLKELMIDLDDIDRSLSGFDLNEIEVLVGSLDFKFPEKPAPAERGVKVVSKPVADEEDDDFSEDFADEQDEDEDETEENTPDKAADSSQEGDGVSYVVYLSFSDKKTAEKWLIENGFEDKLFKTNKRTVVIDM
jgi:ParB-like chromosome segregation protein Spo0J